MKKKHVDMLSGSVMRGLLALTMPVMIMNVAQSLFTLADTALLKAFGHATAVGAAGAVGTLQTVFTHVISGVSVGAGVVIARNLGAKRRADAERAISTGFILAIAIGLTLLIGGSLLARPLLLLTNCSEVLLPEATTYFRIYFYGAPILAVYSLAAGALRAIGDTRRPMRILFIGCSAKLVLSVLLLSLTGKGVESAALSTLLANLIKMVLSLAALLRSREVVTVNLTRPVFDGPALRATLYNGLPPTIQTVLYSLANVVLLSVVNTFGPDATTGISIANQYDGVIYNLIHAPSLAVIPYIAQNIGAGDTGRAKQAMRCGMLIGVGFGLTFGSFSALFAPQLAGLLATSTAARDFAVQKMIIISSTYFICGINEVLGGTLKGMGRTIPPSVTSLIYMCAFRFVWVYGIFPLVPNLTFLYLVWPISWILCIVTQIPFLRRALRALEKKKMAVPSGAAVD